MALMERDIVIVINTSPDTVALLRDALQHAGMTVLSAFTFDIRDGRVNLTEFIGQLDPKVVVYDIAPPYGPNWTLFERVRSLDIMKGRQFVLTSPNPKNVETLVGRDEQVYEVVGKPLDLDLIVQAVKEALRARPTR
jgi:DNA-binding response OmpR family regulator